MIAVQSFLETKAGLVPVEQFTGPIADEYHVEGAIELTVDGTPLLSAGYVDYVDQLWHYLVKGLAEVGAGKRFDTNYPSSPIRVVFEPDVRRRLVVVAVNAGIPVRQAAPREEFMRAMCAAGRTFFERLQPLVQRARPAVDGVLQKIAALEARIGQP